MLLYKIVKFIANMRKKKPTAAEYVGRWLGLTVVMMLVMINGEASIIIILLKARKLRKHSAKKNLLKFIQSLFSSIQFSIKIMRRGIGIDWDIGMALFLLDGKVLFLLSSLWN